MNSTHCLLFIPAKDEEKTIAAVIAACVLQLQKAFSSYSVLVVNDGSSDNTESVAKAAGATVITHKTNRGLGRAFQRAVSYAIDQKVDYMLTIDADGQFSPEEIPKFFNKQKEEEADMVTGSRFLQDSKLSGIPKIKRYGNHSMTALVNSLLRSSFTDVSCGYRLYTREALLHLTLSGDFTYTQEVFLNLGYKQKRICEVPISVQYFATRKSRIAHNLWQYAKRTSAIIFKSVFKYKPFQLLGSISALFFLLGMVITLPLSYRFFVFHVISPYKSLAIIGLFFLMLSFFSIILGVILHTMSQSLLQIEHILYYEKKSQTT